MDNLIPCKILRQRFHCDMQHIERCLAYLGLSHAKEGRCFYLKPEDAEAVIRLKESTPARELQRRMTEATLERRYGDKHYNNRGLMKETKTKHFGSAEALRESIRVKRRETCLKRYGGDPNALEWKKKKCIETVQSKYGVDNVLQLPSTKAAWHAKVDIAKAVEKGRASWNQNQRKRKRVLEEQAGTNLVNVKELSDCIIPGGVDFGTLHHNISRMGIQRYHSAGLTYITQADVAKLKEYYETATSLGISAEEKELLEYVRSLGDFEVQENVKGKLEGNYELDIYLPGKQLAIEFNGTYWHSDKALCSIDQVPSDEAREKARTRHLHKTEMCAARGIRCLHVFEQDWLERPEVVKSVICHILGCTPRSVPARKCTIEELSHDEYRSFLEENHLLGYSFADVRLGLRYGSELVVAMGIHERGTHSKAPEMVRLCTKKFTSVPGGFSKLLSFATRTRNYSTIVSYIDRAMYSGAGYAEAGFASVKTNPPTFCVVKGSKAYPRWKFMKCRQKEMYERGELAYFNPDETEAVNLYKNGYGLLWNCGTVKVEWHRDKA